MYLYLVDLGVLLNKYSQGGFYSSVYDKKYGYHNKNKYLVRNLEEAIKDVEEFVNVAKNGAYGVITEQKGFKNNLTDEEISNIQINNMEYKCTDVVYSLKQEEGVLSEFFIVNPNLRNSELICNFLTNISHYSPKYFINDRNELIIEPKNNIYFSLEGIMTETNLKCKILAWLSRPSCKGVSYY